MTQDFFTDMLIGGVIFTFIGLPIFHREPNGERTKLPERLSDVRANHYGAVVSVVSWYVGRAMLLVGAVGYIATAFM